MLVKVLVENFKSVESFEAGFGRFSVLVGPSGSGKSSVLEALALLMQSRGEPWLLVEGPLIIIHDPVDVVRRRGRPIGIGVWWELDGEVLGFVYRFEPASGFVRQELYRGSELVVAAERRGDRGAIVAPVEQDLCVPPFAVMSEDAFVPCSESGVVAEAERVAMRLRTGLRDKFFFLSERRSCSWKRTYETLVDLLPNFSIGPDAQYLVHQLSRAVAGDSGILDRIGRVFGISDIRVALAGSGRLDAYFSSGGLAYPSIHSGLGVKFGLPVLVSVLLAPPGSTVAIDSFFEGVDEDLGERLLAEVVDVARSRGLQLVVTERSRWGASLLEKYGFSLVWLK